MFVIPLPSIQSMEVVLMDTEVPGAILLPEIFDLMVGHIVPQVDKWDPLDVHLFKHIIHDPPFMGLKPGRKKAESINLTFMKLMKLHLDLF